MTNANPNPIPKSAIKWPTPPPCPPVTYEISCYVPFDHLEIVPGSIKQTESGIEFDLRRKGDPDGPTYKGTITS